MKTTKPEQEISTLSGIPLKPFYGPEDAASSPPPGEFPYTRGIHPTMYQGRLWTMRQFSGFSTPQKTNERYRYLLSQGQTGLSVAFDLPTLMGYDADQPESAGEVGKCGVAISSLRDMETLFSGIPLGEVSVSMTINSPAPILFAMYLAVAQQQGVAFERLQGTLQNDILKEYIAQKEFIFPPRPSMRFATDVIEYATRHVPSYNPISISGYHIREAGSTAVQELAFTLRNGIEYVEWALKRGLSIDEFGPRLSFFFNAHNDFFEEIAKYRAARTLWASIARERFGSKSQKVQKMRFHAQTAGCSLTWQQPMNNVVRTAVQAMAAVMGGTQSLHTNSLDEAYALPSEHAVTLALRTQQILAFETGVTDVPDPFGGSYYLEALTAEMVKAAGHYIEQIDAMGGVLPAIERGFLQNEIANASYTYQQEIDGRERIQVGVNAYVEADEEPLELLAIDDSAEREQRVALESLQQERDELQVWSSLKRLKDDAEGEANLLPALLESVKAYATLGEIVAVLKGVFGVYTEPSRA